MTHHEQEELLGKAASAADKNHPYQSRSEDAPVEVSKDTPRGTPTGFKNIVMSYHPVIAGVILTAFFLPWLNIGGLISIPGHRMPDALSGFSQLGAAFGAEPSFQSRLLLNYSYSLYVIPLLSCLVLAIAFMGYNYDRIANGLGIFVTLGFLIAGIYSGFEVFTVMSIGAYTTLLCGVGLTVGAALEHFKGITLPNKSLPSAPNWVGLTLIAILVIGMGAPSLFTFIGGKSGKTPETLDSLAQTTLRNLAREEDSFFKRQNKYVSCDETTCPQAFGNTQLIPEGMKVFISGSPSHFLAWAYHPEGEGQVFHWDSDYGGYQGITGKNWPPEAASQTISWSEKVPEFAEKSIKERYAKYGIDWSQETPFSFAVVDIGNDHPEEVLVEFNPFRINDYEVFSDRCWVRVNGFTGDKYPNCKSEILLLSRGTNSDGEFFIQGAIPVEIPDRYSFKDLKIANSRTWGFSDFIIEFLGNSEVSTEMLEFDGTSYVAKEY